VHGTRYARLPSMVRWLRQWGTTVAFFAALAVLIPLTARAQNCPNVSISVNSLVPRYYPGADTTANLFPVRPQNLNPTWINYSDCKSDINLEFTLLISGLPCTDTIQVWAGTVDCTQVAARQADSGQTHCWPVTVQGAFTMASTSTGNLRAQDIVQFITNAEPPETYTRAGPKACQSQDAPGSVALGLYFMAIEPDGQTVDGTSAEYDMGADLLGPYPPSSVTAGVGENLIVVNWTPATDSTIQGFNIYCQAQGMVGAEGAPVMPQEASVICPGGATMTDAAGDATLMSSDSGCHSVNLLDAGGSGGQACVSSVLVDEFQLGTTSSITDGAIAPIIDSSTGTDGAPIAGTAVGISDIAPSFLCGQVGGNTTSSYVVTNFSDGGPPIMDGTEYAVGVAAFDGTGNTGILGPLSCVIPAKVKDFWTEYTSAGGLAGGGFCALQGPGMPVSGSLMGIGMGVTALAFARRRRRRR
jgi:hypothetical protein